MKAYKIILKHGKLNCDLEVWLNSKKHITTNSIQKKYIV